MTSPSMRPSRRLWLTFSSIWASARPTLPRDSWYRPTGSGSQHAIPNALPRSPSFRREWGGPS